MIISKIQIKFNHLIKKFNYFGFNNLCKYFSNEANSLAESKFRNIGIIAHIDAGKTTTTERMLFYSNYINYVGEVHNGNTVMDYMEQERERGITISSAAISFPWQDCMVNLIDTPGHVDFTMEVERSLRVIDGAVAVFDASAGVEAQSMKVWMQADNYELPRICFLNKMDKPNADYDMCLLDIEKKLKVKTLPVHFPFSVSGKFSGIVDLLNFNVLDWSRSKQTLGKQFKSFKLTRKFDEDLYQKCADRRAALIENLADLENSVAENILENETTENIPLELLNKALKYCTLNKLATPVLIGSAYKNIGVQPLMDAICDLLPAPSREKHPEIRSLGSALCAFAFKVVFHKHHGPLTFLRVYSGTIHQGKKVYNPNQKNHETILKLMHPYADDFKEVQNAPEGGIVVASGLKTTVTGDLLVHSEETYLKIESSIDSYRKADTGFKPSLFAMSIPEPVLMCSIEAPSLSKQKLLKHALDCLQKEDPSLKVKTDQESGQTILAGMGELHLSVIHDRISKEYKVDADLGPLIISYRESLTQYHQHTTSLKKKIGDKTHEVNLTLSLEPCEGFQMDEIPFAHTRENAENLQSIRKYQLEAIKRGVASSLMCGPVLRFPVIDVKPRLHWLDVGRHTSPTFVEAAAFQTVQKILKKSEGVLLEPVMRLEIVVPDDKSSVVLGDLSKRRAQINYVGMRHELKVIDAICPLSELMGFSTSIRVISSGLANISMEFAFYKQMTDDEKSSVLSSLTYN